VKTEDTLYLQQHETYLLCKKDLERKTKQLQSLETQYATYYEETQQEMTQLKAENMKLQKRLIAETEARELILQLHSTGSTNNHNHHQQQNNNNNNNNNQHTVQLLMEARNQNDIITAEYEKIAIELQFAAQNVFHYKELYEQAIQDKKNETTAAQEAATVAAEACLKRAELDAENQEILQELIEMKVLYANVAMDCDYERRKALILKKTLQYYAEKLATMELKYLQHRERDTLRKEELLQQQLAQTVGQDSMILSTEIEEMKEIARTTRTGTGGSSVV
jgi:hypothetical protein